MTLQKYYDYDDNDDYDYHHYYYKIIGFERAAKCTIATRIAKTLKIILQGTSLAAIFQLFIDKILFVLGLNIFYMWTYDKVETERGSKP